MDDALASIAAEPALAWKQAVLLGGAAPDSPEAQAAALCVRRSALVEELLAGRERDGHAYFKWTGSHWILSVLADLGCPPGDASLRPLMEETFAFWLSEGHQRKHMRMLAGRMRRCASQEGYAVWSSLRLGFADGRTDELVRRLLEWQWPDGGWNCDKRPDAHVSSFMETLIPLRALALYARVRGEAQVRRAAERAAEVFLARRLFRRRSDGAPMDPAFLRLSYPPYWHYHLLFALKVMAESGVLSDPRCAEALDWLEARRLPDGGFPAEESFSRRSRPDLSGYAPVAWGGKSPRRANPFVSVDALYVLRQAGRA